MSLLPGRWSMLACLALVAATPPLAANCKVFRLTVPDPADLNLRDGEHVLASVATDRGLLEARVTVRNRTASSPTYTLGGKPFRTVPDSDVPPDLLKCTRDAQQTRPRGDGGTGSPILQSVPFAAPDMQQDENGSAAPSRPGPGAGARGTCSVVVSCGSGVCVATACCNYNIIRTACSTAVVLT